MNKPPLNYSKMLVVVLSAFFYLLSGCHDSPKSKDELLQSDIWKVAKELEAMRETDQQIRNTGKFMDFYYGDLTQERLFDEFNWKEYDFAKMGDSLDDFFNRPTFSNDRLRIEYTTKIDQRSIASEYVDSVTLNRLIEITEYYGFPSHERLEQFLPDSVSTSLTGSPMLIFVHTPESKKDIVEELIIREYKAGRIDIRPCSHIFWHLNGREEWPINFDYCAKFD